jgi:hypothetical protein
MGQETGHRQMPETASQEWVHAVTHPGVGACGHTPYTRFVKCPEVFAIFETQQSSSMESDVEVRTKSRFVYIIWPKIFSLQPSLPGAKIDKKNCHVA